MPNLQTTIRRIAYRAARIELPGDFGRAAARGGRETFSTTGEIQADGAGGGRPSEITHTCLRANRATAASPSNDP